MAKNDITDGEYAAARRLYVPAANDNLSFEEFCEERPDELAELVEEAKKRADDQGEDLDHLQESSTEVMAEPAEVHTTYGTGGTRTDKEKAEQAKREQAEIDEARKAQADEVKARETAAREAEAKTTKK